MKKKQRFMYLVIGYGIAILLSLLFDYQPGIKIGLNFYNFAKTMFSILPCAFILIGLFEVWIKRETVQKYFGKSSGLKGYFWAILLSSTTIGGAYVAFPIAYSLYQKGGKLSIVLTYIGATAITRIPMTIFEASFLGLKFSIIRLAVSIPLVVLSSNIIERYYGHKIKINDRILD